MEQRHIIELWRQGSACVLTTLVRVEGSSYRRAGARLLLAVNGSHAGTISGGCLESDVLRRSKWMVRQGAVMERYSTTFDDTAELPFGLGCGGTLDLLLEPTDTRECEALLQAMEHALLGERHTVVTHLPDNSKPLRRVVLDAARTVRFASKGLSDTEVDCARNLQPGEQHASLFIEELHPPQRLFLLGAGDDAQPMVRMAHLLGWNVMVADGRIQLARAERFPEAQRVSVLETNDIRMLGIRPEDAVVVMTHSYQQDRELLTALLPLRPRYLGLLGARHRSSLLISEAAATLDWNVAACCDLIYAPVGLDLGGDGPEAIALAVIAEAQACCQGKIGASRRLTPQDIAEQVACGSASRYLQVQCAL